MGSQEKAARRRGAMLKTDLRRLWTQKLLYILLLIALLTPVLVVVMVTMMEGTVSVDPTTGAETVMEGFDSAWQMIASPSGTAMGMDITSMCNINLMYFAVGVFVCLFVAGEFRCGYAKNLFTVRAHRGDYVRSKTIVSILVGVLMLLCFLVGSMLGGAMMGLPFALGEGGILGLLLCMLSKCALMAVFVPIFLIIAVSAREKAWLSICCSLGGGMLLFMMIPMLTPLDATVVHLGMCLAGGLLFSFGLGAGSKTILNRANIL